ncbi:MAG TPA: molybdopterin cofactor-binding domain-containing protein [Burkholderiales bacterium]|nr:molybdopterin cofactor-binding domain-containing protein [Burkholderiales bacterium]
MDSVRRTLLKASLWVGGGLILGFSLPAKSATLLGAATPGPSRDEAAVTAWVRITPDNQVRLIVSQAEMGQGITTTLPAILADELGADWFRVQLETAPFSNTATAYRNPARSWMFTGNSESIESFYDLMRKTGAAAREMLTRAAAARWGVPASTCSVKGSAVIHPVSGRRLTFGEVATDAARLPIPEKPTLRASSELRLTGKSLPRVDVPPKVDGSAIFGIDFSVPGMLIGAVRTPPTIGGRIRSFDEATVRSKPGVLAVVPVLNGVAVVADTYWQARTALAAAAFDFDPGPNADLGTPAVRAAYRKALDDGPWATPVNEGDAQKALAAAANTIGSDYESPFAAHVTMEPMNCTALVTADKCEIWAPTQGQELAFVALKSVLGMRDDQISVNRTPYLGGGFGRRLLPDFVIQAALVSKAVGKPVKLIWDREEDMRRDWYRPATMVRLTAALEKDGLPAALATRVVSPTILLPVFPPVETMLKEKGFDPGAMEGMMKTPYALLNRRVDFHLLKTPIPTSVMRTTGYGPNIFALESFIDELAHSARIDPYQYRRRLLRKNPRALAVLDRAAILGEWGRPLPKGRGRGFAFTDAFGTLLAQVIEVHVEGSDVRVEHITSVVDCGRVLDPDIAASNIEGGAVFGLAYCKAELTFRDGRAEQENLNSYELPYLAETPRFRTEFINGAAKLGGIGEVSPITVPPALANAIFAASGRRIRSMPLSRHGLRFV